MSGLLATPPHGVAAASQTREGHGAGGGLGDGSHEAVADGRVADVVVRVHVELVDQPRERRRRVDRRDDVGLAVCKDVSQPTGCTGKRAPLPTAEVRVIVMPPVPGNAKAVGVLSERVEKPAVLGFDQVTWAETVVAAERTTARTRRISQTFVSEFLESTNASMKTITVPIARACSHQVTNQAADPPPAASH